MKRWPTKPLSELSETVMGQAPPGGECNFDGIGTPFVKAGEFGESRPIIREWTTKPLKFAKANDVLVCVVGATCGKLNLGADCAIGRSVAAIRPDEKLLNTGFLYAFLQGWTKRLRSGSQGSAQGVITRDMLASIPIAVPPLAEQERIVKLLDEADELRKLRAQADYRTADLIPALFHEMFGDPARNEHKLELVKLIDVISKEKHSIKRGPFGGAIKKEIFVADGFKIYEQKNAIRNDFEIGSYFINEAKFKELESFSILPDDLIISCSGTIGKVAIVPRGAKPGIINQALLKLHLDTTKALPVFFKHLLENDHMQRLIFGGAAGSAIKNVMPLDQVKKAVFPLPPLALQKEFIQRATEIRELEAGQTTSRTRLDALFQSMLHRAFNGEL